jgi:WD40 repeat protein/predicted Ser/Thr protein kinase
MVENPLPQPVPDNLSRLASHASCVADHSSLPRSFGDYELLEEIGHGGMGIVYRARQKSLDRIVALKLLLFGPHAPPESVKRFRAEAVATAALQHPNIVAIHEVGFCEGQHFIAMDFVEGQSLSRLVRGSPLPVRRAAGYVKAIAEAIHYAHERGILHRDLKPANVLIDAKDQPRITDFGLAKRLEGDSDLTVSGQVLGSPNYMPPEQASGKRGTLSRRSDVYALGAILYHALTGRPPFVGEGMAETVQRVLNEEPASPRLLNPGVPVDLETVCLKCLEKDTAKRYATAQILAEELGRFLEGKPVHARPVSRPAKVWRWCRRNPRLATAVAAALLSLLIGLAGVSWQWRRAESQRQRAEADELMARQNAYASDMLLAQQAQAAGDLWLTESLLDKHRPGRKAESRKQKTETDLRGWEWRYLWQLCQADESSKLQANAASVGVMAISRDGRTMAVEMGENRVVLWDLMSRRTVNELPAPHKIDRLRLSSNGNLLAVASRPARGEPTVEVWDLPAREIRRALSYSSPIRSLAFSPDGRLLATFEDRGGVRLVEWATDRTLTNFPVPRSRQTGTGVVEFSPDGSRLLIGEGYGRIRILDWRTGSVVTVMNLTQTGEGVTALACSPDSDLFAAGLGYAGGVIHLLDARSGESRGQLMGHRGMVRGLAFTPDGQRLAVACADRTIRVWSVVDQAEPPSLRGHAGEGRVLAFLPDGRTLASGCQETVACLWDLTATRSSISHTNLTISYGYSSQTTLEATNLPRESIDQRTVRRFGLAFTPDGRHFITTDREGTLGVWETRSARCVDPLPALGSNHWGVALSPDGRWLAAGVTSGKVNLWDWKERHLVKTVEIPFEWFGDLRFSRSGHFLFGRTVRNDRTASVRIWRTNDWAIVPLGATQSANLYSVDLSRDDRLLATGYAHGYVRLGPFPSRERETTILNDVGAVTALVFSPDDRVLALATEKGDVRLWSMVAGQELPTRRGHLAAYSAAFSPDGRRLATGGDLAKDAVRLWDIATQREILTLQPEGETFFQVAWSSDESALVATGFTGVTHLWRAPSWEEIAAAERGKLAP